MPGKVLIIDDLATNRIILKVKLSAAYYEVSQAASVDEARVLLARSRPDLILLGVRLADDTTLTQTIRQLQKTQAEAPAIPVVVLLDSDNANDRVLALRAGAEQVLSRPLDEQMLLARLRNLMRQLLTDQDLHHHTLTAHAMGFAEQQQGFASPGQIGLIAQDKQTTRKLQIRLAAHVSHSLRMMSAEDIMGAAASSPEQLSAPALVPDMFVMQMGDGDQQDGLRLLSELRADPGTRNCPVIALLPRDAAAMAAQLLDLGASDVVFSDTDPQEIALRLGKQLDLKRSRDRLRDRLQDGLQAAVIDQLTGLYNRRYALSYLNCLMEARDTTTSSFAVMVADLDYFKQVNDTYGHAAGDAVLARVAKLLSSHLRKDDLVARIGGEEFLIIVPGTTQEQARKIATELCQRVRDTPIALPGRTDPAHVTISIGLTLGNAISSGAEDMLEQADRALYRSKAAGRDTVRCSTRSAA